ncbi:MAG: DUF3868 domain-containing protein [Clostridium sp.]|nr:DUF3868 domain-containing protein [Prevotella sp.]MCM1429025.1 DUF3868 domain-containing protein [Clostridium sp.]MCM1475444.1 DUF3868 domain-containing protein [Muribaculaceae bacterium]
MISKYMTIMTLKHILGVAAICVAFVQTAWAKEMRSDSTTVNLYDINVKVDELAQRMNVKIELDVEKFTVSRDREMILTPVLIADDRTDSICLEPMIVAGRSRWYHYLRSGVLDDGKAPIFRAGKKGNAVYDTEFDMLPWMGHSSLEMRVETANCCDSPTLVPGMSDNGMVPIAHIDIARPALNADYVFAPPVDAGPVEKNIEGSAFVTFVVNRTELKPDYMNNRKELNKIIQSIEFVRKDPDATITHVHIKGFASPEGPYDNNVRLAQGRTETLRRYVRDLYKFQDRIVTSGYEPEDWAGLRKYMTDSMQFNIAHRSEIIDIIDGPLGFDNKNLAIQTRFPEDYNIILKEIYPWLRHSDYNVEYVIKVYTSLEDIRRVYASDPTNLRAVDFYTLAQSYPEGSKEYCDVFETAVSVYPDDPMLNLNAANIELMRGEYDRAQSHLLKAGNSPIVDYARGILAAKRGDAKGALVLFNKAKEAGLDNMDKVIEDTEAIRDYYPVTYFIKGSKPADDNKK